jgi:hypothetical protein
LPCPIVSLCALLFHFMPCWLSTPYCFALCLVVLSCPVVSLCALLFLHAFVILPCALLLCLALLLHVAPHLACLNAPLRCTTPCYFISWPIASPCLVSFQVAPLLFSILPCCFD